MRILAALGLLVLTGCSADAIVRSAFPDREILEFATSDGLSIVSYACEKGATERATRARATQAHNFVETNIEAAAEIFANRIVTSADNGETGLGAAFGAASGLNANAERITEEAEARYQCLLFDERAA